MSPYPDLIATLNSMVEEHQQRAASLAMEAIGTDAEDQSFACVPVREARDAVVRFRTLREIRDLVVHAQGMPARGRHHRLAVTKGKA